MPAYVTIHYEFDRKANNSVFVRDFYAALLTHGAHFKSVYEWFVPPDATLEDVIQRNQKKLDKDFELGYTQHVKHDYWQILIDIANFSECRVYLSNTKRSNSFSFHLIVPENEVLKYDYDQLLKMSQNVWFSLKPQCIQTYFEEGMAVAFESICGKQYPPSTTLFSFIPDNCYSNNFDSKFNIKQLSNGFFLTPKTLMELMS